MRSLYTLGTLATLFGGCIDLGSVTGGGDPTADMARAPGDDLSFDSGDCNDGQKDGDESDVDCGGGGECARCSPGRACNAASDCASNTCKNGLCAAPPASCADGVKNGEETDVDCGGGICPRCADGKGCAIAADCREQVCTGGTCRAAATCNDGIQNGAETDVDCGGGGCPACANGKHCNGGGDCASATCIGGTCASPMASCNDGIKNGSETDVDCGGVQCNHCANGRACGGNSDCASNDCSSGFCVAMMMMGNCHNGIKDGNETDVDCGGGTCPVCRDLQHCLMASDCEAFACENNRCVSCSDGLKDDGESDVDCGGVCEPCKNNQHCTQNFECESWKCSNGTCIDACHDGIKQGYETDVDCGGYCPPCASMKGCSLDQDCISRICENDFFCQ